MHQTNHLAKTRKNAFDKAIAQLLAELNLARQTIEATMFALNSDMDKETLTKALRQRLRDLDEMQQKRG
jgi:hypothetical protein